VDEQVETIYGRERVYLNNRRGFLRLAIIHGVPVVPSYTFGSSDTTAESRSETSTPREAPPLPLADAPCVHCGGKGVPHTQKARVQLTFGTVNMFDESWDSGNRSTSSAAAPGARALG